MGNDLSCRFFQLPAQNGGQFYYAKAFDKFAPIGPALVSPELFNSGDKTTLTTRVNGKVTQNVEIQKDRIFSPAQVLSFMSQSKEPLRLISRKMKLIFGSRHNYTRVHSRYDRHPSWCRCVHDTQTIPTTQRCSGS